MSSNAPAAQLRGYQPQIIHRTMDLYEYNTISENIRSQLEGVDRDDDAQVG